MKVFLSLSHSFPLVSNVDCILFFRQQQELKQDSAARKNWTGLSGVAVDLLVAFTLFQFLLLLLMFCFFFEG